MKEAQLTLYLKDSFDFLEAEQLCRCSMFFSLETSKQADWRLFNLTSNSLDAVYLWPCLNVMIKRILDLP